MGGDKLDARLVIGGLWEGAPLVDGEGTHGTALGYVDAGGECGCFFGWYDTEPEGGLSLRLPGPLGLGLEGLLRRVRERVGIDAEGVLEEQRSGATWITADLIAKACRAGGDRIVWASRYLAMTDALAAKLGWPTGPGAPVWAWTRSGIGAAVWWKLSARASTTESWIHEFNCDLEGLDASLEAVWRRECAS